LSEANDPAKQAEIRHLAKMFHREMQFEVAFYPAGGLLLAGSDAVLFDVIAGFADHRELEVLVDAGFTPLEAIKVATLNGAKFLRQADQIGSLEVGKQADIILVKGDLSVNIRDIENVEIVFKDGVGYDSKKLIESIKGQVGNR
jgi:predicted amidohydrolase YtcJ